MARKFPSWSNDIVAASVLGLLSAIWCVAFLLHLDPLTFPDSKAYLALAENIRNWNWTDFHFRTPGYPAFLAAVQLLVQSDDIVYPVALQVIMTACVPLLLYGIFRCATESVAIGFAAALVFFVDWAGQLMSVALLTEALTQFALLIAVFLAVLLIRSPGGKKAVLLAVVLFALTMIRPAFLPLGTAYSFILLVLYWRTGALVWKNGIGAVAIFLLPLFLTALWSLEVKRETGRYGMSHITGIALFNQVSDLVPEIDRFRDQELLEFLKSRVEAGAGLNAGWDIIIERGKQDKATEWETALALKELSVELIRRHPDAYLRKVVQNSHEFWTDSATYVYLPSETALWLQKKTAVRAVMNWLDAQFWLRPGRILFLLLMVCLVTALHLAMPGVRPQARACTAVLFSTIALCMITHVAVNGADLARYRMPVQTLYLAYCVYLGGITGRALIHRGRQYVGRSE